MIKKYRKKPIIIEAVQFDGTEGSVDLIDQLNEGGNRQVEKLYSLLSLKGSSVLQYPLVGLQIPTLEGDMKANVGDYIIKGINGEIYPCKPDIFHKTYEEYNES